ncbi:MAG: hypothetical protein CMF33_03200, partial [Leeuwenhoekiella sp.]|nr:hypothetical protein [Leeuwenhoekiella sp.]
FASPKKTNQKKRAPRLGIFRLRGENRLASSASLSLLSFGAASDYSEPRERNSFNPSGLNVAELSYELAPNSLFLRREVGDEDNRDSLLF